MKKLLFVATALVVVSMSSCKKDYTCKDSDLGTYQACLKCNKAAKDIAESACKSNGGTLEKD